MQGASRRLGDVRAWGCQYVAISPAAIAASGLDLVVVEPILDGSRDRIASRGEIALMQRRPDGRRRLVLAYLALGAAARHRAYWQPDWAAAPPAWLGPECTEWPGSHAVRYWHPAWRAIVTAMLDRIAGAGFDGVCLDRVDAFHDWAGERRQAQDDMARLVATLLDRARARVPGFLALALNAEQLLERPGHRARLDAVCKESLLTGLGAPGADNAPADVDWSLAHLRRARADGLAVLAIEYLDDPARIATLRPRLEALGFVPFFATRNLDRLPDADVHGPAAQIPSPARAMIARPLSMSSREPNAQV
jgi:cysteinyl-tRNA synthetase